MRSARRSELYLWALVGGAVFVTGVVAGFVAELVRRVTRK